MSDIKPITPGSIAVIIPTYNQEAFLAEAVESVFAQTRLPDQVFIVNDASTDGTNKVAEELVKKYPLISYLPLKSNSGVAVACNMALELVTAEFVVRLDGDDTLPPNYLEMLAKTMAGQPENVAFAYCAATLFGAGGGEIKARRWSVGRLAPENYIHVSSLVRTRAAREVQYFDTSLKGYEDWDFYLKLADRGYRGVPCYDTYLNYRQKPEGGRNTMTKARDTALRQEIYDRHPRIYDSVMTQFRIFWWRVTRKLGHLAKKMRKVS